MDKEIFIKGKQIITLEEVPNDEFDAWLKTDDKDEGYEEFLKRITEEGKDKDQEKEGQESKIVLDDELLVQEKLQIEKEQLEEEKEIKGAKNQSEIEDWNKKFLAWENEHEHHEICMEKDHEKEESENVE